MNIFCSANGTIFHVDPEPIYQGSVGVNKIRFIGQFPSSSQVLMSYKLPQGDYTMPKFMASVAELQEVQAPNGGKFSVWEALIGASPKIDTETGQVVKDENGQVLYDLDYTITQNYGTATLQFFVYGAGTAVLANGILQNTEYGRLATASTSFNILKGVPVIIPDLETDENQELLTQILNIVANTQELYADASQRLNIAEQYIQDLNNNVEDLKAQAEDFEEDIDNLQSGKADKDELTPIKNDIASINTQLNGQDGIEQRLSSLNSGVSTAYSKSLENERNISGLQSNVAGLQNNVAQNTSDINGLRQDIINEAHFRGYVETNAEIQALQGNANDYAYSAEGGTIWVYQNGEWVNSGKEVPSQGIPASNATPLMDGEANAGQASEYARGDHRHPSDTTKVNVIDFNNLFIASLTENETQLTSEEKAAACNWLGALPKQTGVTTYSQAYAKASDGSQTFYDIASDATGGAIVQRDSNGRITCNSPATAAQAANKGYVDNTFVAKQIGTPDGCATRGFLYGLQYDGTTPDLYKVQVQSNVNTIPLRNANGNFYVGTPTLKYECASKGYIDEGFIALPTLPPSFNYVLTLNQNGEANTIKYSTGVDVNSIPQRDIAGNIKTNTPVNSVDCVPLGYFNTNKGTKLYKHAIDVTVYLTLGVGTLTKTATLSFISSSNARYTALKNNDTVFDIIRLRNEGLSPTLFCYVIDDNDDYYRLNVLDATSNGLEFIAAFASPSEVEHFFAVIETTDQDVENYTITEL